MPPASQAAKAVGRVVPVHKKYTLQSTGIWERFRRVFVVAPERSNGVPLNPQFRNPPPGALDATTYHDPITIPAGDIAENPYWKRDARRNYPKLSVMKQGDVAGLLSVGSKALPREDVPLVGEEGAKQLIAVEKEGQEKGLAAHFVKDPESVERILGPDGLPPLPGSWGAKEMKKYELLEEEEQSFPDTYPCRNFV
ncbi:MAG: hypothetical protein M1834_001959 [Cirrosporium novae-zelandiae]|nr:MAG: hypothetical protein M1834_001959 [Cirrosporium novae-zelandiae]